MTKPKRTEKQDAIAKQLKDCLRARIKSGGGMILKGQKGVGKTLIIGGMNSKAPKDVKLLNLFFACQTAYAEKQAEEVGVARGDMPLTLGRMPMLKKRLGDADTGATTFTLTPASAGNLLNPEQKLHDELIKLVKKKDVNCIHIEVDEVHKAYKGHSNKPALVAAFREELRNIGITLVVTGITATPLWDVKSKDQERLARRACMLLGLEAAEGETAVEALEKHLVEVSTADAKGIFDETKPLQTEAPEAFEVREVNPTKDPSQELEGCMADAKSMLLGLALDGSQGHIDRLVSFFLCLSMAVVRKVLDDRMIESVLPMDGVQCKTVVKDGDGGLSLSTEATTARSNALIVVDSPEARKYLMAQLKDRAENEEDARPMQFFDLTTKDRVTFQKSLDAFVEATKTMTSGHPIGFIDPAQLEGSNDFGKNCFAIIAVGTFPPHLKDQGAGRLGRPVPMEAGDLVPIDGYKAVHIASKWQTALAGALKSKGETLPNQVNGLLKTYEKARKKDMMEVFGEADDDEPDPVFVRVETTAKQLAKVDAAKHLPKPFELAKTFMEAVLDEEKKEKHLTAAFGKLSTDLKTRARAGSMLAKYSPTSAADAEEANEVMHDNADDA